MLVMWLIGWEAWEKYDIYDCLVVY